MELYVLYAGLGVVLGHNFPFYLHFKGGKGIASMAGILVSMDWRVTLVCSLSFPGGGDPHQIRVPGLDPGGDCFLYPDGVLRPAGDYAVAEGDRMEFFAVAGVLMVMAIWRHRANIRRLLKGTENKLWGNKEK